jgi:hypothetical protein
MKEPYAKWINKPIRCFQNVSEYKAIEDPDYCWDIVFEKESTPMNQEAPVYFILDSQNHAAFSHWVYENATWLPFFLQIQTNYPSCSIVLNELKDYKKLFLQDYGIPLGKIRLVSDIEKENYCFFHTYTSLNDKSIPEIYYTNVLEYEKRLGNPLPKTIPLLYLPRGTKENLQGPNNRTYNVQTQLKKFVKDMGGTVYETDTTRSLQDQITLVKSAKIILLDYGSNLWVNGLFAQNSNILCLNIGWMHHQQFPSLKCVWNLIQKKNTIKEIFAHPSDESSDSSIPVVCFHLPFIINDILTLLNVS